MHFLSSFLQDRNFSSNIARFLQEACKIFLPNNFLQDSYKTLTYVGLLQENHACCKVLQVLARNKLPVV